MSTTTTIMARSPFSTAAFAQLVRRLRHTNARYNQIARQFRCRIRPTHHAKRRAYHAGLHIDTSKARACPNKYVSTHPPPILDLSASMPWDGMYATAENGEGDAYMRGVPLRNLPEVVVKRPRRRDGRPRVVLRLPPLRLQLDVDYVSPCEGTMPGAPRLLPRQLPEEEDVEHMLLASDSSSDGSDELLTPVDVRVYPSLCITIPPRNLKRKLHDVEADEDAVFRQPKRFLKVRWNESRRQ